MGRGTGFRPLDQSIQSGILAMAFVIAAEIERDLISQRTKEALAAKRHEIRASKGWRDKQTGQASHRD